MVSCIFYIFEVVHDEQPESKWSTFPFVKCIFYRKTIVGKYGRVYESYLRVPLEILILERNSISVLKFNNK